jgi:hypothetical protein
MMKRRREKEKKKDNAEARRAQRNAEKRAGCKEIEGASRSS